MAKVTREESEAARAAIVNAAAISFMEHGFTNATVKDITSRIGVSTGSFNSHFRTKEDVLCELVSLVFGRQFEAAEKFVAGKTDDKVLLYAAETALQLHIVEMDEKLRDIYSAAYSLPKTSDIIRQNTTTRLENIFKDYLPDRETKDFYLLEIATGGIMRGFMTVPCSMWFSMDTKVQAFLENTLRLYHTPDEKIAEAVAFAKSLDLDAAARATVDGIMTYLKEQDVQVPERSRKPKKKK